MEDKQAVIVEFFIMVAFAFIFFCFAVAYRKLFKDEVVKNRTLSDEIVDLKCACKDRDEVYRKLNKIQEILNG